MCIFINIIKIHSTHTYYVNKNLFWMIVINRLTALISINVYFRNNMFKQVNYFKNNVYLSINQSIYLMIMTKKRCEVKQAAVMGHNSLLRTINHFVQQMATDTTNRLHCIQNILQCFKH